jgi:hypothetical protein
MPFPNSDCGSRTQNRRSPRREIGIAANPAPPLFIGTASPLKAIACNANRVYHPLVFLVDEPIDGFIAKRVFLANPRTAVPCFSGLCASERAYALHIRFSAGH